MPTSLGRHSYTQDDYTLHWPDPQTHPHEIQQRAETLLKEFQKTYLDKSKSVSERLSTRNCIDATLFPLIQAGQINIHEEEMTFQLLFRLLKSLKNAHRPLLDLTSGYFSLYKPYQDLILSSPGVDCRIVAASPKVGKHRPWLSHSLTSISQANGFFGSNGISGRIPEGYTLYEQRFMKAVKKAGRLWKGTSGDAGKGVSLSEWAKQGWTYHAKGAIFSFMSFKICLTVAIGIWLSPSSSSLPVLTLFGSTNLNSRSAHLDTELSFLMLIPSEASGDHETKPSPNLPLRKALAQEVDRIRSHTVHWKGEERKVRFTTKIIVWLVKGML
jgi:CDP-diacylglycerol--glycerol-3-phosphate 3-phosphatidyltransferase